MLDRTSAQKIIEARRAMEFADKMNALQEQREQALRNRRGDFTQALINETFNNEEKKLKKEYGVQEYVTCGNQRYGRLYQEPQNNPVQEHRNDGRRSSQEPPAKILQPFVQEKLTALEASARYLTYDEWKCGLTKAPDWVYDKGMSEENNPKNKAETNLTEKKQYGTMSW